MSYIPHSSMKISVLDGEILKVKSAVVAGKIINDDRNLNAFLLQWTDLRMVILWHNLRGVVLMAKSTLSFIDRG